MTDIRIIVSSFPSAEQAREAATLLVQQRLAACVNLLPAMESIYYWQEKLCREKEVLALIKTPASQVEALLLKLAELHPYEVPEMLVLQPEQVAASYERWIHSVTE
jgi:periplasmic divalent cation tolerance protein